MDPIRRLIESTATVLNLLLGTRLLWRPRPNGFRMRLRALMTAVRHNPDLLIDFVYGLRYPLAASTTLFAGLVVGYEFFFRADEPVLLGVKLAGAAFVIGMGVLTVGAGRTARRLTGQIRRASAQRRSEDGGAARLTPLRKLARHAFLIHLYLLVGAVGMLALSVLGIRANILRSAVSGVYDHWVLTFFILLLAQGLLTLPHVIRRLRKSRAMVLSRSLPS
jgi:hypothetical protein